MKSNKSIIIFYFILIIFYLIFYINCETCTSCTSNKFSCSGSDCPSNCKPNYQGTQCYDCSNYPNYYSIDSSSCNQCTGNKIIFESKECVDSCNSPMYIMSDACYRNCPEYSMIDGNLCKCLYNYYFTTVTTTDSDSDPLKIQHCLPPNIVPTGYNFYNMNGEFLNDCDTSSYYLKNEIIGGKSVTRCSSGCIGNEFEYEDENDGKKYCLDSCPSGTKTFNNFDNRKCLSSSDKCSDVNPNFYEKNNICVDKNECIVYYNEKCYNYCSEIGENYHKIYGGLGPIPNPQSPYHN